MDPSSLFGRQRAHLSVNFFSPPVRGLDNGLVCQWPTLPPPYLSKCSPLGMKLYAEKPWCLVAWSRTQKKKERKTRKLCSYPTKPTSALMGNQPVLNNTPSPSLCKYNNKHVHCCLFALLPSPFVICYPSSHASVFLSNYLLAKRTRRRCFLDGPDRWNQS